METRGHFRVKLGWSPTMTRKSCHIMQQATTCERVWDQWVGRIGQHLQITNCRPCFSASSNRWISIWLKVKSLTATAVIRGVGHCPQLLLSWGGNECWESEERNYFRQTAQSRTALEHTAVGCTAVHTLFEQQTHSVDCIFGWCVVCIAVHG